MDGPGFGFPQSGLSRGRATLINTAGHAPGSQPVEAVMQILAPSAFAYSVPFFFVLLVAQRL
jgi:hypothetical protein